MVLFPMDLSALIVNLIWLRYWYW